MRLTEGNVTNLLGLVLDPVAALVAEVVVGWWPLWLPLLLGRLVEWLIG